MRNLINISDISSFRKPLMGYAILFVMLVHADGWFSVPHVVSNVIGKLAALIHVQGFFFLSGFGLYYSLSKNHKVKSFYIKRLGRVWIPFMIIALPFYLYFLFLGKTSFIEFILNESALYYFFYGNNGMWYISVSLLFYLVAPFIFKFVYLQDTKQLQRSILLILLSVLLCLGIFLKFPDYYSLVGLGIAKMPIFIIGFYFAYLSLNNNKPFSIRYWIVVFLIIIVSAFAQKQVPFIEPFYKEIVILLGIPVMTIFFKTIKDTTVSRVFSWLGSYSLELYILHMMLRGFIVSLFDSVLQIERSEIMNIILTIIVLGFSFILCKPSQKVTQSLTNKILANNK